MNASLVRFLVPLCVLALLVAACGSSSSDSGGGAGTTDSSIVGELTPSGPDSPADPAVSIASALQVVVTTSLDVSVANVRETYDRAATLTRDAGGFVATAQLNQGSETSTALVRLRVPDERHDDLVAWLKTLPDMRLDGERVDSKEISGEYTDLQSRLRNLERTEAQYQQFLTQATTIDEVLKVDKSLQTTRDEIEKARGRLNLYDNQVAYANVNLNLALLPVAKAQEQASTVDVFVDAWQASLEVLDFLSRAAAVMLVAVIWLVPLAVAGLIAQRLYRRVAPALNRIRL